MSYLKPQTPLQHKDGDYFYPLTTIDQIIMEDGVTRLNGADLISVNTDGAPEGETASINADTLGGYAADAYIRQDNSKALLSVNLNKIVNGTASPTNADMLGNVPAEKVFSDLDGKLSMELLWENASPTSEFIAQSVNIDLSGYHNLLIQFRTYNEHSSVFCDVDLSLYQVWYNTTGPNSFLTIRRRDFTISTDSIAFSGAYEATNAKAEWASDRSLVPVRIYGIKGVAA